MKEEVRFLRGLAKDWGFVALAEERLDELRRSEATSESDQRMLAQVRPEVQYLGARRIRDLAKRQEVLAKAIEAFEAYLGQYGRDAEAAGVLGSLAEASEYYGSFLSDKISLERDPDKKKALEEEALSVFMKGIKAANEARSALESRKDEPQAQIDYFLAWLRKGTLLIAWAQTVEKDKQVKSEEAITTLEELALEAGEETPIGIKALQEMGNAFDVQGKTNDAIDNFQATIDIVDEVVNGPNRPRLSTCALLFRFLEESYKYMTDIYVREGMTDKVTEALKAYQEHKQKMDLPSTPQIADAVLLNGAQAQFDLGGVDNTTAALTTAKDIATRHPANFVGLKAREIINAILTKSNVAVGADALFQAAQGEFQNKNYEASVSGFKRVLRNLRTPEDQKKWGLRTYYQMGGAFALRKRYLEAYHTFIAGLRSYGRNAEDDKLAGRVVDQLNKVVRSLGRQKKDKDFVANLKGQADRVARQYATGDTLENLVLTDARNKIEAGKYAAAIADLNKITRDNDQFELAWAMKAFSHMKKGDHAAARKELAAYDKYVKDPLNEIPSSDTKRAQIRDYARADCDFYKGMMFADEAFGRNGKKADPSKYKDVVQAFRNYGKQWGALRPTYASRAAYELVKSLVDLERLGEAESEYSRLRKESKGDPLLANLAVVLFKARTTNVDAIEQEIGALIGNDEKKAALREATQRLRTEIRKTLSFAKNYLEVETEPDYQLLRDSSKFASRIDDFDQAEFFLQKILAIYGKDPKRKESIDKFIRPELAEILMEKGEFPTALAQIEASIKLRPNSFPLKRLKARALGGWAAFDSNSERKRPSGTGDFEAAYKVMYEDYGRLIRSKSTKKYSLEWFQFYFDCMDLALKASTKNSDYLATAKKFYSIASDDFEALKAIGPKGRNLHLLFQTYRPN